MLQKPLDKGYVITAILVNLRCIPLAEAVRADLFITKVIAYNRKLFLYRPFGDGKDSVGAGDAVPKAVVFQILLDDKRDSKNTLFACFLLCDGKAVSTKPCRIKTAGGREKDVLQ